MSDRTDADFATTSEAPGQGTLFDVFGNEDEVGYRVPIAQQVAGITYRQLDYWARTNLVKPSIRGAHGSGSQRLYSFRDILVLKIVKGLLDTGISLQNIRKAVEKLENLGIEDLSGITLVSDGTTVYECRSNEEVIDLLHDGHGVFGIAVPGLMKELSATITTFPSERIGANGEMETVFADSENVTSFNELASRRARRA